MLLCLKGYVFGICYFSMRVLYLLLFCVGWGCLCCCVRYILYFEEWYVLFDLNVMNMGFVLFVVCN